MTTDAFIVDAVRTPLGRLGGALAGVVIALLSVDERVSKSIEAFSAETGLSSLLSGLFQTFGVDAVHAGHVGYQVFGVCCFALMGGVLFAFARKK